MRRIASLLSASVSVLSVLAACGPAGGGLTAGDPTIEHLQGEGGELPPHILVCSYFKNLDQPLRVVTYLDETEDAMSLYDFAHSEAQMVTWMRHYPGGKAYGFRTRGDGTDTQQTAIGRAVSEPCFGNGAEANRVIRQAIVHRAPGANARDALHALLKAGRTTHFLVDTDGTVYEVLDPVHQAFAPTEHANVAIYVAVVSPRRLPEWVPAILSPGASQGAAGALAAHPGQSNGAVVPVPADAFAERSLCTVRGQTSRSEPLTSAQEGALRVLLAALAQEYPRLPLEPPPAAQGGPLTDVLGDSLFHSGLLAEFHIAGAPPEPACLDFARILRSP